MPSSAAVFKFLFRLTAVCDIGATAVNDFVSKPRSHAAVLSVVCIGIFLLTELFELAEEFGHNERSTQRRVLGLLLLAAAIVIGLSGAVQHREASEKTATGKALDSKTTSTNPTCKLSRAVDLILEDPSTDAAGAHQDNTEPRLRKR